MLGPSPNSCVETPPLDVREMGLWVASRPWGWSPHSWDQCPYENDANKLFYSLSATRGHGGVGSSPPPRRGLSSDLGQHPDLRLPELGEMSLCCLEATQSVWHFVITAQTDWDHTSQLKLATCQDFRSCPVGRPVIREISKATELTSANLGMCNCPPSTV